MQTTRKTHIDLVNDFENTDQTVESFNKLFTNTPLGASYSPSDSVEILEVVRVPQRIVRVLSVNDELVEHIFEPYMQTGAMRFKEEYKANKKPDTVICLIGKDNVVKKVFNTTKEASDYFGLTAGGVRSIIRSKRVLGFRNIRGIAKGDTLVRKNY